MRIETLEPGVEFTVKVIREKDNPVIRKLSAMGLKEGRKAKVLLKNGRVILLQLGASRLIIDKDLASFIEVA